MKETYGGGLMQLGVIPLLIPIVVCAVIFVIATQTFDLPSRNWAIIVFGFAATWYGLLWAGLRRVAHPTEANRPMDSGARGARTWRPLARRLLRSPGGLLSVLLGSWLVVFGDRHLGMILLAVGVLLLSVMQLRRG